MKVFLIDDELPCIDELSFLLRKYPDIEIAGTCTDSLKALAAVEDARPDAVFLDIDMPRMDGLELALKIQTLCEGIIVIFVTAHAKYALDAFKAYPLDYLLKPVKEARLDDAVTHLRRHYALLHPAGARENRIKIKCFGSFEVLSDSDARWSTRRVRELLLYLIDRHGVAATKSEMLDALFDGQSGKNTVNNLYVTISRLKSLLDCWDSGRKLIRLTEDNALYIAPGVCDYADFMSFARQNAAISGKSAVEAARVLNLCKGLYLEKEHCEWAVESANEVEAEYERIALGLAGHYTASCLSPEAENVLCALLARNPLSAAGYAALLDLYMKSGNRAAYAARYEEYARVLKKELRLKPPARYSDHYNSLKH